MQEPKILKGFRDFLPAQESLRSSIIDKFSDICKLYSFAKIDTPTLEYKEILLSKAGGETEKQIYQFKDNGDRDVALRFDLTVPFARFYAMHKDNLEYPFKRFQIGKVFRGENTQRGRYREFVQFDFDILGSNSILTEKEIFLLIRDCFKSIGKEVKIHFFSREIFNKFLSKFKLSNTPDVLRVIDKVKKVPKELIIQDLTNLTDENTAQSVYEFISQKDEKSVIENIKKENIDTADLENILEFAKANNIPLVLDPSITRGLDYYTGTVFETFLVGDESLGAVCSGGRYDNLISLYSKDSVSGIGGAFGIDRIVAGLKDTESKYFLGILNFDNSLQDYYFKLAGELRGLGMPVDIFLDNKKIKNQFNYFEKKGVAHVLIVGKDEHDSGVVKIKNIEKREEETVKKEDLSQRLKELYGGFIQNNSL